jgi:hypothetical protein
MLGGSLHKLHVGTKRGGPETIISLSKLIGAKQDGKAIRIHTFWLRGVSHTGVVGALYWCDAIGLS